MSDTGHLPRTFWWHNCAQFSGAMNDNLFKLLIIYALIAWNGAESASSVLFSVSLTFALPFLLIVPFAGNIADKFSKRRLIVLLKGTEVAVMSFGALALTLKIDALLYVTMFLMSAQSAFYGPCKYGLIPEQVATTALSKANGALQLFTFLAIIAGTTVAPELSLLVKDRFGLAALACIAVACLGFMASLNIAPSPAHSERTLQYNGYSSLIHTYRHITKDGFLLLSILALGLFSLIAGFIQLNILLFGAEQLNLSNEQSTRLFLLTAIGIGLGSTFAGWISGRSIEFGIVPIGAFLMSASLLTLGLLSEGNLPLAAICMLTLGFAAGLFIVPLEAFVQFRSPKDRIGSIQAANSFTSWIGILAAGGLLHLNSSVLSNTAQSAFLFFSILLMVLAIFALWVLPDFFIKFVVMCITRCCYKLRVRGLENLPSDKPALLVCNHVSLMDAVLIMSSQQRRIRMLMSRNFYNQSSWLVRKVVDVAKVVLIQDRDGPKQLLRSLKTAREALDEGYLVCIFAEGTLSRTGMMRPFKPGFERIVKGSEHPIIPVYIGGAWGSVSSYYEGMPQLRPLKDFRYKVSVHYGEAMPASSTSFEVQQAVSELSVTHFESNKTDSKQLSSEFIESARRNWSKLAQVESSGKRIRYGELLTGSLIIKKHIQKSLTTNEQYIGILLPTGIGSSLANIAVDLTGHISVNLNYTVPSESFQSAIDQCSLRTLLTSRKFLERFPELPLAENTLYIEDIIDSISKPEKARAAFIARCLPTTILSSKTNPSPDDIATVLFSSGSTSEPKGVMLSHYNILSNITSFRSVLNPQREDVMLATLPLFHSFGYTATFWFPLLSGLTIASHNNPLEASTIGKLAAEHTGSILLTTPSFLLAYIRKIQPDQFKHLRHAFTGAEKLQPRIADMFEQRFGIRPYEGYGATELSPVCALSLPNVEVDKLPETGNRPDRLGRVLPGMAIRIIDPDTGKILPPGEEGLIHIKGPNVMHGYLNREDLTNEAIQHGWYNTGDMGVLDEDGFFSITGRLSRFCKIGGEMVSLAIVEKALREAFGLKPDQLVALRLQDERKGERIAVAYCAQQLKQETIQQGLSAVNIPNLWKPKASDWSHVDSIPLLGTGKIDYRAIGTLTAQSEASSLT